MITHFTDTELEIFLNDIESERIERKRNFSGSIAKRVREVVCAFANDVSNSKLPGVLFIGANDDGTPADCAITDELLLNLASMKTDGSILPQPVLSVEKRTLKGAEMAIVIVQPSDMPPVQYDGRIWVRTGPSCTKATRQEERILVEKCRHKNIPFDIRAIPSAKLSDISRVLFEAAYLPAAFAEEVLQANDRTYEERLAACKMLVSPEEPTPTLLGMLVLGIRVQDFLPCAQIQFLRIAGTELTDPVFDADLIGGTLTDMLRRTEEKLKAHNMTAVDVTSGSTHQINSAYPFVALQQVLYNAVLHRTYEGTNAPVRVHWYNDRVEIISPGGPYGNVTPSNFGQPGITDYRNPHIAAVLKLFGYVQTFGRGIALTKSEMKKNGNPEPLFDVNPSIVTCILRSKKCHSVMPSPALS
jgi:ATP-dependent DNA helicase RecG